MRQIVRIATRNRFMMKLSPLLKHLVTKLRLVTFGLRSSASRQTSIIRDATMRSRASHLRRYQAELGNEVLNEEFFHNDSARARRRKRREGSLLFFQDRLPDHRDFCSFFRNALADASYRHLAFVFLA